MKPLLPIFGPVIAAASLAATPLLAHSTGTGSNAFMSGFAHPIFGPDHVLAMVAVGLWAQRIGGRALFLLPAAFVLCMIAGFGLGLTALQLPLVEPMILASVMMLGVLVALAVKPDVKVCVGVVGAFALFHGYAHATEMGSAGALRFGLGFVVATAALHLAGVGVGAGIGRLEGRMASWSARIIGGITAASGALLAFG